MPTALPHACAHARSSTDGVMQLRRKRQGFIAFHFSRMTHTQSIQCVNCARAGDTDQISLPALKRLLPVGRPLPAEVTIAARCIRALDNLARACQTRRAIWGCSLRACRWSPFALRAHQANVCASTSGRNATRTCKRFALRSHEANGAHARSLAERCYKIQANTFTGGGRERWQSCGGRGIVRATHARTVHGTRTAARYAPATPLSRRREQR